MVVILIWIIIMSTYFFVNDFKYKEAPLPAIISLFIKAISFVTGALALVVIFCIFYFY